MKPKSWFRFFLGTPKRFLATLLCVIAAAAFTQLFPGTLQHVLIQLWRELEGIVVPLVLLAIVLRVLFGMIPGFMKSGKK